MDNGKENGNYYIGMRPKTPGRGKLIDVISECLHAENKREALYAKSA